MAFLRPLLGIYTQDDAVISAGVIRTTIIAPTYFLCGMMDVMVGVLRGMGSSIMPMIVSVMGACVFRIFWIYVIFPISPTLEMLYASYPVSWIITLAVHLACYFVVKKREFTISAIET